MWMASCVSAPYLGKRWHQDAVEEGKLAVAVWLSGNVLLGNLESRHSCGCHFHMYHLPKHQCRPSTLLWQLYFPMAVDSFSRTMHPAKIVQEWFEEHDSSRFWFVPLYAPDPIVGSAWNTSLIHGDPTFKITGLKGFAHFFPDTTGQLQRSSGVMHRHVRAVLAAQGDPHNIRQLALMLLLTGATLS